MENVIEITRTLSFTYGQSILEFCYLLSAILFVFGLKMLSHPETARRGNFWAGLGMVLAGMAVGLGGVIFWAVDALAFQAFDVPGSNWAPVLFGVIPIGMALGVRRAGS